MTQNEVNHSKCSLKKKKKEKERKKNRNFGKVAQ